MDAIENFEAKKKPAAPHTPHFNPTFDSSEKDLREQIADLKNFIIKNVPTRNAANFSDEKIVLEFSEGINKKLECLVENVENLSKNFMDHKPILEQEFDSDQKRKLDAESSKELSSQLLQTIHESQSLFMDKILKNIEIEKEEIKNLTIELGQRHNDTNKMMIEINQNMQKNFNNDNFLSKEMEKNVKFLLNILNSKRYLFKFNINKFKSIPENSISSLRSEICEFSKNQFEKIQSQFQEINEASALRIEAIVKRSLIGQEKTQSFERDEIVKETNENVKKYFE